MWSLDPTVYIHAFSNSALYPGIYVCDSVIQRNTCVSPIVYVYGVASVYVRLLCMGYSLDALNVYVSVGL